MVTFEDIETLAAKKKIKVERVEGYPDWCLLVMPSRNTLVWYSREAKEWPVHMMPPVLLTTAEDVLLDRNRKIAPHSIPAGRRKKVYGDWMD
jgi:hypothetical protein